MMVQILIFLECQEIIQTILCSCSYFWFTSFNSFLMYRIKESVTYSEFSLKSIGPCISHFERIIQKGICRILCVTTFCLQFMSLIILKSFEQVSSGWMQSRLIVYWIYCFFKFNELCKCFNLSVKWINSWEVCYKKWKKWLLLINTFTSGMY